MMRGETRRDHRKLIAELAREAFADHKLEQIAQDIRAWKCYKPGTWVYGFYVIAPPGCLLVYGDIGDYMLQANDKDLIPWLRGAIRSPDYLMGKMKRRGREFMRGDAINLIKEIEHGNEEMGTDPDPEQAEAIRELWDSEYDSGEKFAEAIYEVTGDAELACHCWDVDSDALWTVEALRKFVELLDAPQPRLVGNDRRKERGHDRNYARDERADLGRGTR